MIQLTFLIWFSTGSWMQICLNLDVARERDEANWLLFSLLWMINDFSLWSGKVFFFISELLEYAS